MVGWWWMRETLVVSPERCVIIRHPHLPSSSAPSAIRHHPPSPPLACHLDDATGMLWFLHLSFIIPMLTGEWRCLSVAPDNRRAIRADGTQPDPRTAVAWEPDGCQRWHDGTQEPAVSDVRRHHHGR